MSYFSEISLVAYPNLANTDNTYVAMTNILKRSAFLKDVMNNISLFYEYSVKDGETPEIIAEKLYGDVNRFWIVLMFNDLSNPYYDFPLVSEQLHDLITTKYGQTIEQSQTTIHHYEEEITRTVYYNGMPQSSNVSVYTISEKQQNPNTGIAENRPILPGTADTSLVGESYTEDFGNGVTVSVEHVYRAISNYTHELNENEKRRKIRLLDASYVGIVENEYRRLMRDGS